MTVSTIRTSDDFSCRHRAITGSGIRALWEVTAQCNLNCMHCFVPSTSINEELNTLQGIKLIEQMKSLGVSKLMFSGGEPLLRRDIFRFISLANEFKMHTDLVTNGVLVDETVADKLQECGLGEASVSLDGAVEETHDFFRGCKGSYRKTVTAVKLLTDRQIKVDIICVPTAINLKEIGQVIELAASLGACSITLAGLVYKGKALKFRKALELDEKKITGLYDVIRKKRSEFGGSFPIRTIGLIKYAPIESCPAADSIFAVDASGFVHPCIQLKLKEGDDISVKRTSLAEIWKSRRFNEIRQIINSHDLCNTYCLLQNYCGKGCRGLAILEYNDVRAPDPNCALAAS